MKIKLVIPYHPPGCRRFFARYGNGITLRLWNAGLHIWSPA